MIFGTGIDIVEIKRIERIFQRFGEDFLAKNFTKEEVEKFTQCSDHKKMNFLAKRFAAKEASAKALGTGIGEVVGFRDLGVINDVSGKPLIKISGKLHSQLQKIVGTYNIHLSLSDSEKYAIAQVIIEKTN